MTPLYLYHKKFSPPGGTPLTVRGWLYRPWKAGGRTRRSFTAWHAERNGQLYARSLDGENMAELGRRVGLSREQVRRIIGIMRRFKPDGTGRWTKGWQWDQ